MILNLSILNLHHFLFSSSEKRQGSSTKVWLSLSLIFATIYSFLAVQEAFSGEYVIQDDARQHIFWMQRFLDPELFPNDLIADYFKSVAPGGYRSLYWLFSQLGFNPIFLSKIIPWGLDLIATFYCFGVTLELLPIPIAGLISSILLNQQLWLIDDLVSATPRAFVYPLFLGFVYYLLRKSMVGAVIFIGLLGLFYPQAVLISSGVVILQFLFSKDRKNRLVSIISLGVAAAVICYYAASSSEFSPVITVAVAKTMSEFGGAGNSAFFQDNLWRFFIQGQRSGLIPKYLFRPTLIATGLLLPAILFLQYRFKFISKITPKVKILLLILISSLSWFIAAHLMLFRLHLPSRYTSYSFRICLAISAGVVLCVFLNKILVFAIQSPSKAWKKITAFSFTVFLGLSLILGSCFWGKFPKTSYVFAKQPEVYRFFSQQPKDTLIASISPVANNIPSFSQRSVWVAWEYAVPYHLGYYHQIQQRATELIKAQYSSDLSPLQALIQTHGFDFIILDQTAFTREYLLENRWLRQWYHSLGKDILAEYEQGRTPAILQTVQQCSMLQTSEINILNADCIVNFNNISNNI